VPSPIHGAWGGPKGLRKLLTLLIILMVLVRLSKEEVLSCVGPLEGSLLRNVEEEGVLITKVSVISVYNSVPAFSRERAEFAPGTPSLRSELPGAAGARGEAGDILSAWGVWILPAVGFTKRRLVPTQRQPTNQPTNQGARTDGGMVPAGVAELGSLPCEQARLAHAASR
jgi:hypothetical protein